MRPTRSPQRASTPPRPITDTVTWTRQLDPRERYRILYRGRDGETTERLIELLRLGHDHGVDYLGVTHGGKFKTLRADGVIDVLEQLSTGHPPSIQAAPAPLTYADTLPPFPLPDAVYRMPTAKLSKRTWRVDLNHYTCACPEKRRRAALGYTPGSLGWVCSHMAHAILEHLPATAAWPPAVLTFLRDPRRIHIDNLC